VALGVLIATVAGLSYGLFTYAFGRLLDRGHTPRGVIGAVFGGGSPVLLVVLAITGAGLFGSWQNASIVAYLVLGPMVVAYLAFSRALQKVRSSTVATLALLEPVVATALAVLFVGERLGPLALVGGVAVLLSLALVSRASSERTPPKSAYS
jgi:DME family drug/metabolite transporter